MTFTEALNKINTGVYREDVIEGMAYAFSILTGNNVSDIQDRLYSKKTGPLLLSAIITELNNSKQGANIAPEIRELNITILARDSRKIIISALKKIADKVGVSY